MLSIKSFFIMLGLALYSALSFSQKNPPVKYGKISVEDLSKKVYSIDSNAAAVVIADIGETSFTGNNSGGLSIVFTRHRRVHILNKSAYDEANVSVWLYRSSSSSGGEEKLEDVKGMTYNLEDGKILETELEVRKNIFTDQQDKNYTIRKFTLPNVKEGSIIEYVYSVKSDFLFNLQGWDFQGEYPVLWSEYKVSIPGIYEYITLSQGYKDYYINTSEEAREVYNITDSKNAFTSDRGTFSTNVITSRWVVKDMPALKPEPFVSTLQNYIKRISFQLKSIKNNSGLVQDIMGNYPKATKSLLERKDFGLDLDNNNGWLDDYVNPLVKNLSDPLGKAKAIYTYVRDNYTCTDNTSVFMATSLKDVVKSKKGNVAEINLLLTALLKHVKLNASPIILSTRAHGKTYDLYPVMERFNYVIALLQIDSSIYVMDASDPLMGFNHLPLKCYNGHARIINEEATPVEFIADDLLDSKVTSIFLSQEKGKWQGVFQQHNGYYSSYDIREQVKEKGEKGFFESIQKAYAIDGLKISDTYIDSLKLPDENIVMGYNFEFKTDDEDVIYINPLFGEAQKDNPFKSAKRFYPVEMPYSVDETYIFELQIPEGYVVDETPKSTRAMFNENEGFFEYIVSAGTESVKLRSRIKLTRATYDPEEYETLRSFFSMIVKKHAEQIVLKKKK